MSPFLLLLSSCYLEPLPPAQEPLVQVADPVDIPALWAGDFPSGSRITLEGVIVTSPATADRSAFYVQHPGGGPRSGLQVKLGDGLGDWPPPVGSRIRISGTTTLFAGGPTMWLKDEDELELLDGTEEPVAVPFSEDPTLIWALVSAEDVRVTSSVDPAGLASTSLDQRFRPDFGVPTPGWNRTGDLVAINALAAALLLRTEADWTGGLLGDPPVEISTLGTGELVALEDGTPVHIPDLVQATPWSEGERYALLQDAEGDGLWADAEGFGAPDSEPGDVGDWTGELRFGGDGLRIRVWTDPAPLGTRAPLTWTGVPEEAPGGSLVRTAITGLLPLGPRGERGCDSWLLDNRFVDLGGLVDGDEVFGAVRIDGAGLARLAVLPEEEAGTTAP